MPADSATEWHHIAAVGVKNGSVDQTDWTDPPEQPENVDPVDPAVPDGGTPESRPGE